MLYTLEKIKDKCPKESVIKATSVVEGTFLTKPKLGKPFIFLHGRKARVTSTVINIVDETVFETNNGVYLLKLKEC